MGSSQARLTPVLPLLVLLVALLPLASAEKFQKWFSSNEWLLSPIETGVCSPLFAKYRLASSQKEFLDGLNKIQWCHKVEDCVTENLAPNTAANYQAAAVILGIMPTLLANLGPRIREISLLSTNRPILSFLISVGAPAVWPTRVFEFDDPSSSLGKGANRRVMGHQPAVRAVLISIAQYLLVLGAIANVLQVSIILGKQTVLVWSCEFNWAPLAWVLIPVSIHMIAAVSYQYEVHGALKNPHQKQPASGSTANDQKTEYASVSSESARCPLSRRTTFIEDQGKIPWWQREIMISANQPRGLALFLKDTKLPWFVIFCNCFSSIMAFFQLLFGTMVFSSLLFISVTDILRFVLWRYVLSTVVCRMVLVVELMGMQDKEVEDVKKIAGELMNVRNQLHRARNPSPVFAIAHFLAATIRVYVLREPEPTSDSSVCSTHERGQGFELQSLATTLVERVISISHYHARSLDSSEDIVYLLPESIPHDGIIGCWVPELRQHVSAMLRVGRLRREKMAKLIEDEMLNSKAA